MEVTPETVQMSRLSSLGELSSIVQSIKSVE